MAEEENAPVVNVPPEASRPDPALQLGLKIKGPSTVATVVDIIEPEPPYGTKIHIEPKDDMTVGVIQVAPDGTTE